MFGNRVNQDLRITSELPVIRPDSMPAGDHFLQADFPLLIVVSERKITSEWPTICPEPWSSFPRTPFLDNFRFANDRSRASWLFFE